MRACTQEHRRTAGRVDPHNETGWLSDKRTVRQTFRQTDRYVLRLKEYEHESAFCLQASLS